MGALEAPRLKASVREEFSRGLATGTRSLSWGPPAQMQGKVKAMEVLETQSHSSEE